MRRWNRAGMFYPVISFPKVTLSYHKITLAQGVLTVTCPVTIPSDSYHTAWIQLYAAAGDE